MQSALVGDVDSELGVGSSVVKLVSRMMGRLVVIGVLFMAGSAVNSQRRQGFRGVGGGRTLWGWPVRRLSWRSVGRNGWLTASFCFWGILVQW